MHILFLNQYFPPDPAPTGLLMKEVAEALESDGHTVDFVSTRENYHASQHKGKRIFREAKALAWMLLSGISRRRPDVVISATSPPCLLVVASIIAKRYRAKSIHWIMDVYPEIAVATNRLRQGVIVSAIERVMRWCYRKCTHVVVLDTDMANLLRGYRVDAKIIRPWVVNSVTDVHNDIARPSLPWVWIYSGNLGLGHEWKTILQTQALVEQQCPEIRLLFQGGGPMWPAAQAWARELGLRHCDWKPYVPPEKLCESLLRCHCCVASQLPDTQGLIWPSKLSLLLALRRPMIWIGPLNGAIAAELRSLRHVGVFAPGEEREIAKWILDLRSQGGQTISTGEIFDAESFRAASIEMWRKLVSFS
ncbi:MAG: glycosyltransferase family 4 protein [Chthoniobacteraceae bacterium]